jgi:hypothetical protein
MSSDSRVWCGCGLRDAGDAQDGGRVAGEPRAAAAEEVQERQHVFNEERMKATKLGYWLQRHILQSGDQGIQVFLNAVFDFEVFLLDELSRILFGASIFRETIYYVVLLI